jgi:acetoin:2,6-dichlorophenolindophenol oxidoreductase subunit beta
LKVVVPSTPADVVGLMAAAVRDDDPVMFLEEKALYPTNGEVPEGEHVDELGTARVRRSGSDATVVALGTMVHRALAAAEQLAAEGTDCEVIDLRSLVPLDVSTVAASVRKTSRLFTVEESPRLCGWGAELASIMAEECFYDLDAPIRRITTPHVPLPAADSLEDAAIPSVERVVSCVRAGLG